MLPFSEYIAAMAAVVEALTLLPPLMVTPLLPEMAVPPVVFTVTLPPLISITPPATGYAPLAVTTVLSPLMLSLPKAFIGLAPELMSSTEFVMLISPLLKIEVLSVVTFTLLLMILNGASLFANRAVAFA